MEYLDGDRLEFSLLRVGISIVVGIAAAKVYNRYKARIEGEKKEELKASDAERKEVA